MCQLNVDTINCIYYHGSLVDIWPLRTWTVHPFIRPCGRRTEISGFAVHVMDGFGRWTIVFVKMWTDSEGRTDRRSASWTDPDDRPWYWLKWWTGGRSSSVEACFEIVMDLTEMIVGQTLYCYCFPAGINLTQYQVLNTLILNGLNQKRNAQRQKLIREAFSYEHMILWSGATLISSRFHKSEFCFFTNSERQEKYQNETCINYYCRTCSRYV